MKTCKALINSSKLIFIIIFLCCLSTSCGKNKVEDYIKPEDYQKLLKTGLDVDWCKTNDGMKYYNLQTVKDFKSEGVGHVRIRISEDLNDSLLSVLDKVINDCLLNSIIPIIAYQADGFKNNPSDFEIEKAASWWVEIANRYKDINYLLSYDLLIEATDEVRNDSNILNSYFDKIINKIHSIDENRIVFISPRKRSTPEYLSELIIPEIHKAFTMVEWHFYASGPSKTNEEKLWTIGTNEEKQLISKKVKCAYDFQNSNNVYTWVGAIMPSNYNDGDSYTIDEQITFISYVKDCLNDKNIPFAINSDTKFYNRETNTWIDERKEVFDAIFK